MRSVYLDNNATTIVDPKVRDAADPFYCDLYGNSNSLHQLGIDVRPYLNRALDMLYHGIHARDTDDILITGCATESNNQVLKGVYMDIIREGKRTQILTSPIEHPSVMTTVEYLKKLGADVVELPLNREGIVDADILREHIDPDKTALVSLMWANNETGLILPIAELAEVAKENGVLFHTDAVQAIGKIPVDISKVPVDFLTFSGHKFHAPKGVGGLFIRQGVKLSPLLHGGEQMGKRRGGTINSAALVGMGVAMQLAVEALDYEQTEVARLRDKLEAAIAELPNILILGKGSNRVPNTTFVSFEAIEGEAMIWDLNRLGVYASTGSACASEDLHANPTIEAMQISSELAHTGVRFSLSRFTTEADIDYTITAIQDSVARLREVSSAYEKKSS